MPWYLYIALKQLFPTGKKFSFFSLMSILGVVLGVAVLIIVQSVMNGFGDEFRNKIIASDGEIKVRSPEIIYEWEDTLEKIQTVEGVKAVSPYVQGVVMLQFRNIPAFPGIRGIDAELEVNVLPIEQYLKRGNINDLYDETVLISRHLAYRLGIHLGDTVHVYTPLMLERMSKEEVLLPRELEVVGIYETGSQKLDNADTILCTLRVMQELYGIRDGVHGFTVKLHDPDEVHLVSDRLNDVLVEPTRSFTWMETHRDLLFILGLEKTMMYFIILFIILVASFSIAIALMMSVYRKTREIGLLISLGATSKQIASCFCLQGLIIGITGTSLGVLMAHLMLTYRSGIITAIIYVTQSSSAIDKFYGVTEIPSKYETGDFVITILFSIIISTLAGLIPAYKASKLKPADALRSE